MKIPFQCSCRQYFPLNPHSRFPSSILHFPSDRLHFPSHAHSYSNRLISSAINFLWNYPVCLSQHYQDISCTFTFFTFGTPPPCSLALKEPKKCLFPTDLINVLVDLGRYLQVSWLLLLLLHNSVAPMPVGTRLQRRIGINFTRQQNCQQMPTISFCGIFW